jgi:4-amino-4-deoxy-L-arabinose transferase-like glycosyltransferase
MDAKKLWPWLLLLTVLNLVTALFTELYNDEAYYWAYSRFLDWGYFDHPPVIAVFIKIGYAIFSNEFGVRLLSTLSVSAALWLMFKTADTNDVKLYALLMFSVFPFFLFGFTAIPDSPMLFAVALFFWVYQQFLKEESWKWTLILAVVMAFMLYTKYMGILIILFTLASNISLLKRKWFWIASIAGAVLFLPHLYWQYAHDFPSIQYHVVDRSAKAYHYSFTLEYIAAQIFFYGPFVGVFMYWAALRLEAADRFEKALKYSVGGTLVFFLLSSFKGRVEVNWTLAMLVPLVILAMRYFKEPSQARRVLERVAWVTIPIILLVRVHIVYPLGDFKGDRAKDFHGHREFAKAVLEKSGGLPLVSYRYQTASSLWFYTGKPVPVLNLNSRFSQYDLWAFDSTFVNKPAIYVNKFLENNEPILNGMGFRRFETMPVFKFIEFEVITQNGGPVVQVKWNKPVGFYAFTSQYPVMINVEFANREGIIIYNQQLELKPSAAEFVYPIEVPADLRNSLKTAQITLSTNDLGVVRQYPVVELTQ